MEDLKRLRIGDLVYFYDDDTKHPYLVHDVFGNQVSLGQMEYPDVEQDDYVPIGDLRKYKNNDELLVAKEIMNDLLN